MQLPTATPLSPIGFLDRAATVFAERLAVIDGDVRLTYGQVNDRVRRQAAWLRDAGVRPGDRVAVLAPNGRMLLEAHFGVSLAGGVLVALNTRLTPPELQYILEHSGASVLLYDRSVHATAAQLRVSTCLSDGDYEAGLEVSSPGDDLHVHDETALLSLNYTSGTTGRPKGVMYHHRGAFLQALAMAYHGRIVPGSAHLWVLPMFHCNGWAFPWAVTAGGGTHVCLRKVDPSHIWQLLEAESVTSFNAAPTVLIDLAAHPDAHRLDHVVDVATGGAPPSPTLLERLGGLGFRVTHLYGLTETFGPSVVCEFPDDLYDLPLAEQARFKARQGNANIAGNPLRVVNESGDDVPADGKSTGEVVVRGNTVAAGYYRDPEATENSFGSGWFRTGDIAVMHPDGYVELRDRAKDIIITGGENIASIEIEQVLVRHPAVREVAVVAAPDDRWGEVPHAYVALVPGATTTEAELISFARQNLPGFKIPKSVHFGDLPKTSTGKIQKFLLRSR